MAGVNKVILLGNLGADPELRYTAGGQAVADLRIATSRRYQAKDGTTKEETEWHRVVVWGKQAEHCKEYLAKGRQVYIEGRLQTRQWEDKEGQKRWTTEVVANAVQFIGGRAQGGGGGGGGGNYDEPPMPNDFDGPSNSGGSNFGGDDIPF